MKRILPLTLAGVLALSLFACGGNKAPDASTSQPAASQPAASAPGEQPVLTLNQEEVTLNAPGATFQLKWTMEPAVDGAKVEFTSSDESVATVDENGLITAVGNGGTAIVASYGDVSAQCIAYCKWEEEPDASQPAQQPEPKPDASQPSGGSSAASGVDLQAFYEDVSGKYELGMLELADDTLLEQFYPDLVNISAEQKLVYVCMMSMNNGEFGLVQVSDAGDVDAVKAAFQARIDYMVGDGNGPGGAWYPGPTEEWQNNSRIVSNGNYVMMVVNENCDDIVNEFNALF